MSKPKIILDVDTGTDDAVALAMAMLGDECQLLGITTCNGNLELKLTTDNTLRVVELCGKGESVGVYPGADLPMVSTLNPRSAQSLRPLPKREGSGLGKFNIHRDHLPLPETDLKPQDTCAVAWLINTVMTAEPQTITLVAVGPLTNVGLAMRAEPKFASRLKSIVLMGGGHETGNESAAAEFNIWADPEAAEIVLQGGCDVTVIPLDATHKAIVTSKESARIRELGTPASKFVADVIDERIEGYGRRDTEMAAISAAPLHDALALCYALHPECIVKSEKLVCHVDIAGGAAYGRTVIDRRDKLVTEERNCTFAFEPDREYFFNWMYRILEKSSKK